MTILQIFCISIGLLVVFCNKNLLDTFSVGKNVAGAVFLSGQLTIVLKHVSARKQSQAHRVSKKANL